MTIEHMVAALERKTTISGDGFSFDDICEAIDAAIVLLKAQQNKRLVILPCAIDDEIYTIHKNALQCRYDPNICPHSGGKRLDIVEITRFCNHECPIQYDIEKNICEGFEVKDTNKPLTLADAGRWGCEGLETFYSDLGYYRTRENAEETVRIVMAQVNEEAKSRGVDSNSVP